MTLMLPRMARFGLDYTGQLSAKAHKAVGSSFACRYLRDLTTSEVKALHAGGIDLVVVDEHAAGQALGGRVAGQERAKAALLTARVLGLPAGRPIYFAVDFDESEAQAAAVAEHFRGIHDVLDNAGPVNFPTPVPVGVYGGFYTVERLVNNGLVSYVWQTYAWSGGKLSKHANLYQYSNDHVVAGHGVDYDRALTADFGQLGYLGKPLKDPAGIWKAGVVVHMNGDERGEWEIHPEEGENVVMGDHPRKWAAKITVTEQHGVWGIEGQKFEEVK